MALDLNEIVIIHEQTTMTSTENITQKLCCSLVNTLSNSWLLLELKAGEASSSLGSQVVNVVEITDGKLLFSAVINSEQGLKIYAFN